MNTSASKRSFLRTATLGMLLGATAPVVGAAVKPSTPERPKTYVLVHGAWYGGWCWEKVAQALRAQGHTVSTPTCPGLGEQAHLLSRDISLTTFITSITNHILYQGVSDVILVGSGFAGVVISGVADRIPHLIKKLVYVDAMVLSSGLSVFDAQPAAITRQRQQQVLTDGKGVAIPAPPVNAYGKLDNEALAWVSKRLTPHPVGTYEEKLVLANPLGNGLPRIYVDCTASPFAPLVEVKKELRAQAGWTWMELDSHHDPMITDPHALSGLLATV